MKFKKCPARNKGNDEKIGYQCSLFQTTICLFYAKQIWSRSLAGVMSHWSSDTN